MSRLSRIWDAGGAACRAVWIACLTRQGLAFGALMLSAGAGVAFTCLLAWNILYLQDEKRSDDIAYLSFGLLLTLSLIMFSLHRLLGSKQAIEAELWKIKFKLSNGGDEEGDEK